MVDAGSVIGLAVGALLIVLLALVCAVIFKYLLSSRASKPKQSELTYMLTVDRHGNVKIKRHRQNANVIQQWGED